MVESNPALLLAKWLDTLPPEERYQVIGLLLGGGRAAGVVPAAVAPAGVVPAGVVTGGRRQLASTLAGGEDHQLVTIRMPADQHSTLRDWCAEHNFSMAAVIRGLVERFLEEQSRPRPT